MLITPPGYLPVHTHARAQKSVWMSGSFMYAQQFVVQSLSRVRLFATPWTATHQASLSFTISQSMLKLMSIGLVMPSNHLMLCIPFSCCLRSFLASGSFLMSWLSPSGGQSIRASASASVLPMNIQDWFPLRIDWFDILAVHGAVTNLLQHHSLNASILWH